MSAGPLFANLLPDLKLFQQPDHSRSKDQADRERRYGGPRGAKCDLLKYPQKRQNVVILK
jgi:hypothetical protein